VEVMMASKEKGELKVWEDKWIPTTCAMCYASCAIRVRVINGVAIQVEGNPDSYLGARGGICGKAMASLQQIYDPYRLNYPVRRTNPRKGIGVDPQWKRISWDEAIDEIVDRFRKIYYDNPNKILFTGSPPTGFANESVMFSHIFKAAVGGNRFQGGTGLHCGNASHSAAGMNHVSWSVCPDFRYCNYALFFGAGKGVSSGHSMAMLARLRADATARGLKTVAFDPVCHQQGGKSTEWVPLLPGTDVAVALSIANILVNELGVYDREYLRHKTNGSYLVKEDGRYVRDDNGEPLLWDLSSGGAKPWHAPELGEPALEGEYEVTGITCQPAFSVIKEHLKQYTAEWASSVSTVPASTIRRIAGEWAENARIGSTIEIDGVKLPYRPVAACMFRGGQAHSNGMHQYLAVDLLNHLVGACEVPGGLIGWVVRSFGYPETGLPRFEPVASKDGILGSTVWTYGHEAPWPHPEPTMTGRLTLTDVFSCGGTSPFPAARDRDEFYEKLGVTDRCEFLLAQGSNVVMNTGDVEPVAKFLEKIPFYVHYQLYINETSEGFADIVLPDTSPMETLSCWNSEYYHFHYPVGMQPIEYHLRQPVVAPLYERRSSLAFMLQFAYQVGPDIKKKVNQAVNTVLANRGCPPVIGEDEEIAWEELTDRILKSKFGPEHDLNWFKEHGFIQWNKKPEETYWRWFINARSSIYMEHLVDYKEKLRAIVEPSGVEWDYDQATPLLSYFPAAPHRVKEPEYDLFAFSYRDVLFAGTASQGLPWLREAASMNPYSEYLVMNIGTAKEKGIEEGDTVWVENKIGSKIKAVVHLIEGIHPQCVASTSHSGKWSDAQPLGKGKGPFFSALLINDRHHWCPVTLNMETAAKVKVYKAEEKLR
jgi:molybdopterin-containing oxidoreductase family molybdopterin binding subunit